MTENARQWFIGEMKKLEDNLTAKVIPESAETRKLREIWEMLNKCLGKEKDVKEIYL